MSLPAGTRLNRYEIRSRLGAGGMGEVYLAADTQLGRNVALKLLSPGLAADAQARRRFAQESRAASALNHPHIITIYDIASDDGHDFIAMEHVEGETLRGLLGRGRVETRRALELAAQAASGLAAAHEAGIVHRDVKPENLMVTRAGQVKILDFGLAKLVERQQATLTDSRSPTAPGAPEGAGAATAPGTIMGTVAYMSPEQAEGRALDHRTDVFSLGVVLYEMLTGRQPFAAASAVATLHAIINDEPVPAAELNPRLPPEAAEVLAKSLAKDPRERYQHAGDFELDLRRLKRAIESNSLASVRLTSQHGRRARPGGLWTRLMWAAAGALVTAAALSGVAAFRRSAGPPARAVALERVTLTPLTTDPGYEGEPTFSPDGETIAYTSDRTGNFEVFLKQVSGGPDVNLTNNPADDAQPAFSPDGKQIAFVSTRASVSQLVYRSPNTPLMGGDIWVMPALGGSPRRIVREGNYPSWSPDGSAIIYTSGAYRAHKVFRIPAQGGEAREIPVRFKVGEAPPYLFYPSYSPDGRRIVLQGQNDIIFVVSAEGGEAQRVAQGRSPVWSADSRAVIYSNAEPGKNHSLWRVPLPAADGELPGDPEPLTVSRGRDTQAAVSRDGKFIAFAAQDVSCNVEALPFDAEAGRPTGEARPVTTGNDTNYFFSPSPDGRSVVYQSYRGTSYHIWRVDAGSAPAQLLSDPRFDDRRPAWSPDGQSVAFDRREVTKAGAGGLWLMSPDGANPRQLVEKGGGAMWLPDGRAFVYIFDKWLYFYDLATGTERLVADEPGIMGFGSVSPDGKWVVYQSAAAGNADVRAVPVDGGESRVIVATPREDFHPFFSPSGRWLYFGPDHKNLYRVPGPAQGWRQAEPEKVTDFPPTGLFIEEPQFSRDGRQLFYSRGRTTGDLWLMRLDN